MVDYLVVLMVAMMVDYLVVLLVAMSAVLMAV